MKFLLASIKTLTNSKARKPRHNFLYQLPSLSLVNFLHVSTVHLSLDAGKIRVNLHISGSGASRMLFKTYTHTIH
jgi:hypothetical protein